ncbi:MAG: aminodeoxychorismate synthase component I [Ignavibacterium sp.]|nr:aminodeoxychorismate synthase component I [Ignavibacterium sp.]MCX7611391.1 aminodeoxychorismate synthase component I [Ignavibacterium sp.]MDW8375718.1 aminodeoxychorismate synthase component I [Ignavibacteriales bacterium]
MIDIKEIFKILVKKNYSAFFFTPPIYKKAQSFLFHKPKKIVKIFVANHSQNFKLIDELISKGLVGYAIINYEAGFLFERKLNHFLDKKELLAEFLFYDKNEFEVINSEKIIFDFNSNYNIKNFRLNVSRNEYINSIQRIKNYIEAGDTYQVNFTVKGKFVFTGEISSLFQNLVFNQSAKYIGVINLPEKFIISISPELFFEVHKNKIITRPMKGTSHRGFNLQSDHLSKYRLELSEKEKAENVMIVDLLRNDLGRISKFGSVKVNKLFYIEKYETVFQMVSEIQASLKKGTKFSDIIKNIFPCGSVTGAPKIRTMEIIQELEKEKRNVYTGSIGIFLKDKISFNVAIRTLVIDKKTNKGEIGLGSGIVWDSAPPKEYEEVKLKSKFLTSPQKHFEIFETVLVENCKCVFLKEHLERMKLTAEYFLFKFDEKDIQKQIKKSLNTVKDDNKYKLKIKLNKYGIISTEIKEIFTSSTKIKVIISKSRVRSDDKFQFFKTTNRMLYDNELKYYSKQGFFEVIYFNEKNELAEGSFTNIFIKKNNKIFTPDLSAGILNGIYRSHFIKLNPDVKETKLSFEDLIKADEVFLTNSVRGIIKVDEIYLNNREYISYSEK